MTRTVFCRKYQQDLPALETPPLPGPRGQEILNTVSAKAWQEWMAHQTRLINEKRLKVFEPATRQYLQEQMEGFFNNEEIDQAEGYVPPSDQ
ncbi:oxidative damage protection protein [Marinospirillum alkaliphilum]|uniref:Probable Fe(2+)-trafficking protein n=1 Tax=Marinospirillum alkaliphilum DSM 21637 TaxID=1122209 RepID=A0A1K1Z829_9GAMM|nr:oxidative damage protection protein [Marinospirillum alkaliphilum]SFX70270.1 Fe-S cluster biosynthesis and repair protein YggX [Marinospirillum alkaliphilum DSM 21637]